MNHTSCRFELLLTADPFPFPPATVGSLNTPVSHGIEPEVRKGRKLTKVGVTAPSDADTSASGDSFVAGEEEGGGRSRGRRLAAADAEAAAAAARRSAVLRLTAAHRGSAGDALSDANGDEGSEGSEGSEGGEGGEGRRPLNGPHGRVYVTEGNDEVLIRFFPRCADGQLNQMSPPCGARAAPRDPHGAHGRRGRTLTNRKLAGGGTGV